jgi:predicted metalloenzyme YecM
MELSDYKDFLDSLFSEIEKSGINVSNLPLDHIGISVSSSGEYEKTKEQFLKLGKLYGEHTVSDRRVSVFQITKPFKYRDYVVSAVEVVEPKAGEKTLTKYEHVEFTIKESFEEFVNNYPNLSWDKSNINRPDFPRLKLVFSNGMEIKFNHTPILKS